MRHDSVGNRRNDCPKVLLATSPPPVARVQDLTKTYVSGVGPADTDNSKVPVRSVVYSA